MASIVAIAGVSLKFAKVGASSLLQLRNMRQWDKNLQALLGGFLTSFDAFKLKWKAAAETVDSGVAKHLEEYLLNPEEEKLEKLNEACSQCSLLVHGDKLKTLLQFLDLLLGKAAAIKEVFAKLGKDVVRKKKILGLIRDATRYEALEKSISVHVKELEFLDSQFQQTLALVKEALDSAMPEFRMKAVPALAREFWCASFRVMREIPEFTFLQTYKEFAGRKQLSKSEEKTLHEKLIQNDKVAIHKFVEVAIAFGFPFLPERIQKDELHKKFACSLGMFTRVCSMILWV